MVYRHVSEVLLHQIDGCEGERELGVNYTMCVACGFREESSICVDLMVDNTIVSF